MEEVPILKPCPFCGGPAEYMARVEFRMHTGSWFGVCCKFHCTVAPHTGWHRSSEAAIAAWETRGAG
jgi:hypothetical protein